MFYVLNVGRKSLQSTLVALFYAATLLIISDCTLGLTYGSCRPL